MPTPAWNALAAESVTMENHLADSADLLAAYRGWWSGGTAIAEHTNVSLASRLAKHGIVAELFTDEPKILDHDLTESFSTQFIEHDSPNDADIAPHDSRIGTVLASALDGLEKPRNAFLRWVHVSAMASPWDAPYDLREYFAAEDDPEPPRYLLPENVELPPGFDPDQLLGVTQAYSAQVMLADMCLGMFLDALEEISPTDTLLICTSPRGFPLGEHRVVGTNMEMLSSEMTHVPLFVRFPDGRGAGVRELGLSHHANLYSTLCDWFELPQSGRPGSGKSLLPLADGGVFAGRENHLIVGSSRLGLRTPDWLLIVDRRSWEQDRQRAEFILDRDTTELYAKPDDRSEFNNVFDLCQREAQGLAREMAKLFDECDPLKKVPDHG